MKGKTFKIGNTTIIIRETVAKEEDIKRCYDVCNELFRDKKECFYTTEETKKKNMLLKKQKQDKEMLG